MVPVAGWSWCYHCGHRSVGVESPVLAPTARKPRVRASELALAARLVPVWCWVLLGGLVFLACVTSTRGALGKYLLASAGKKEKKDENAPRREEAAPDTEAQDSPTPAERTGPETQPEAAAPKKVVTRCVIVGYRIKEGVVRLLTATAEGKELRYAGEVPLGEDKAVQKDLLARFASLKSSTALFPDLDVKAVWLRPRLSCEVEAEGLKDQLLKAPRFLNLVFPKKPQPVRLPATEEAEAAEPDKAAPAKTDPSR
jgi:hypothetical protein